MKVLMFGWEYPPHVFGGLATANYGISQGLHAQGDMDITLCLPKPFGDEDRTACNIVAMNAVPIAWRDVNYDYVRDRVGNIMDPDLYFKLRDHIYADFNYMHVNDLGAMEFAGGYPGNLHEEINNYSIIAGVVARTFDFDIIHAHDWLTYPAGIHAKQVSGKPLCIHVHATDFDRSRGKVKRPDHTGKDKVVTFLGRITMQKGPEYFVEAANMVIRRTRNVRFCMAGSGDMMDAMIRLAAERGIADRFHFPGFMRGKQVYECLKDSDVYVMPSVSEPFGISPLEAMQCGTPSIISKQSGCAEILHNCIKVDYWDIHALADAIYSICANDSLFQYLKEEGKKEVDQITWEKVGAWIATLYKRTLGWEQ